MSELRSASNSSSSFSLPSVHFTRGDEARRTEVPSGSSSPADAAFADAAQRQGEVKITLHVLPFLQIDSTVLETADDEYYLVPCYAKRVILRRRGEEFALRMADVRVEEVEMRLGVGQGGGRLAIEFQGRKRQESIVLKDRMARIWKELDKCMLAAVDVRSVVLVMREDESVRKKSMMRSAVRSVFSKATAR
ncbi:hypothetical protein M409DRAFT_51147 [Zasmidium cellare ATCC 36951]|uniref:Uncharacterized protein n=1 Tax=Zasmidium cellare ATCC 36951 TaxID=1080233 RepID=A0A6A6CUR6_ZASCE|nr:uncharacterized protein M409DRAFT_51147 [Zasmidium cellare ATCC 36951]KAF2170904.1 hypothetical protein M409DRAFT_51147 [Zasmidium cellare ATCC 36951]